MSWHHNYIELINLSLKLRSKITSGAGVEKNVFCVGFFLGGGNMKFFDFEIA